MGMFIAHAKQSRSTGLPYNIRVMNELLKEKFGQNWSGTLQGVLLLGSLAYWATVIYYAWTQMMPRAKYSILFLGGSIIIYTLDEAIDSYNARDKLDLILLCIISAIVIVFSAYMYTNFELLYFERVGYSLPHEHILGVTMIFIFSYLTYRSYGFAFLGVLLLALFYGYFGPFFPGMLNHSGYSWTRIVSILIWEWEGFYGSITRIVAAWVALFILYAGLLTGYGAFDVILRISFKTASYIRSGVAQSAVIASMIIGSINGAQTANAALTGSMTIPMMKQSGIKSKTAAGIEAVASSGGQIMPPVMGAAAFLMASFLGISYFDVIIAGLLPAIIFFISVAIAVHFTTINQIGDQSMNIEDYIDTVRPQKALVLDVFKFGIPFGILIYLLGVVQWTIMTAALITVVATVTTGLIFPLLENALFKDQEAIGVEFLNALRDTAAGAKSGAIIMAPIALIIAAINGIVDLLVSTGIPGIFSLALMDVSGGVLIIAAILAMTVCIILGLGMPTVAAYSIVAILIAPALVEEFAVTTIAVHYFVFYSAILSGLTPPIAIAVVITTGIAESNFWGTCAEALKLSLPLFILPFVFLYHPELVSGGLTAMSLVSASIALFGAMSISYGLSIVKPPHYSTVSESFSRFVFQLAFVLLGIIAMAYPSNVIRLTALFISFSFLAFYSRRISLFFDRSVP